MKKFVISYIVIILAILLSIQCVSAANGYDVNTIDNYLGKKIINLEYYHSSGNYYPYVKRVDKNGNLQCAGYAYARLEEKLGLSPNFRSGAGAKDIPSNAPNGATRTAIDGTTYTIEVYKNDNGSHMTSNCWVSFGAGSSSYGHVIYVEEIIGDYVYYTESGTNMWKKGTTGTLRKKSKNDFINNCSSGGKYVGTVVFRPETSAAACKSHSYDNSGYCKNCGSEYSANITRPVSTLSINFTKYPSSISQGNSFGLRGEITSNYNIVSVKGYIIDSNGSVVQSTSDSPDSTTMNIRYASLNQNLIFDKLNAGTYTLKVIATDSYGKSIQWERAFTVNAGNATGNNSVSTPASNQDTTQTTSIKFSLESVPSGNLPYGKAFTLSGKFTSDSAIVEARAYMLDANNNVIMEAKGSSTTSNYYIKGYALDKGMKFNELSPGGYYLKYYVRDANGDTATWISNMFYIVK